MMPAVPGMLSRMIAAIVAGPLQRDDLLEVLQRPLAHSSASVVAWNALR